MRKPATRKIITEYVYPPVPSRQYDWRAVYDSYEPGDWMGTGADEAEAIADLMAQSEYEGGVEIVHWRDS